MGLKATRVTTRRLDPNVSAESTESGEERALAWVKLGKIRRSVAFTREGVLDP
jgi:hypothetical protein